MGLLGIEEADILLEASHWWPRWQLSPSVAAEPQGKLSLHSPGSGRGVMAQLLLTYAGCEPCACALRRNVPAWRLLQSSQHAATEEAMGGNPAWSTLPAPIWFRAEGAGRELRWGAFPTQSQPENAPNSVHVCWPGVTVLTHPHLAAHCSRATPRQQNPKPTEEP